MSKTTPILLTTRTLSKAADAIVAEQQALLAQPQPRALSKPRVLAILAGLIAGPKHDWGYLTGAKDRIVARDSQRFAQEAAPSAATLYFYQMDERDDWGRGISGPFTSRAELLDDLAAQSYWKSPDYDTAEALATLATQDEFVFYSSDDPRFEDGDTSPYSITIFSCAVPKAQTPPATPAGPRPIIGYQIYDRNGDPYEQADGNGPASFEVFARIEEAQAYIARQPQDQRDWLLARPVREGDIEGYSFF